MAGTLVLGAAAIVALSALRQLTPAVAPIAELGNVVLPGALFAIAGLMLTTPAAPSLPPRPGAHQHPS